MKHTLVAILLVGLAAIGRGDDPPKAKMADNPGPEHQALMKMAGDYSTKTEMRMGDAPPQASTGASKLTAAMGGRFLMDESTGEMMGQKYTSHKMYGFNNKAKHYEGLWTYTGSTAMMPLSGKSSDGGKTIEFTGTVDEGVENKTVFTITMKRIDDDHFTVTLQHKDQPSGPAMTTTYSRKK